MAPSSSSTRKAAKLAQKGKGKRVRFQGGTLFPMVVAIVLVVGLALIVYARASRPAADASSPQIYQSDGTGDHWHGAYGFQICSDTPNIQLAGDLEAKDVNGQLVSQAFQTTGIHSHDDGVIHWHAWTARASGRNAQIGIFLDNYDVSLSNDKLVLPEGPAGDRLGALIFPGGAPDNPDDYPLTYEEGETQCNGEDASLKVVVWQDFRDPNSDRTYTSNFDEIHFDRNGLVVVVAFVPDDVDVEMPSWAADLEELGAVDSGNTVGAVETTVPDTTTGGTEPDGTGGSDTTEAASDDTADTTDEPAANTTQADSETTEGAPETTSGD